MGMYTELFIEGEIDESKLTPAIVAALQLLFGWRDATTEETITRQELVRTLDHALFQAPRWLHINNSHSFYHVPTSACGLSKNHTGYAFVGRSDLKNYDQEIQLLLDFLKPYCDKLRGWVWYEEWDAPVIFDLERNLFPLETLVT